MISINPSDLGYPADNLSFVLAPPSLAVEGLCGHVTAAACRPSTCGPSHRSSIGRPSTPLCCLFFWLCARIPTHCVYCGER